MPVSTRSRPTSHTTTCTVALGQNSRARPTPRLMRPRSSKQAPVGALAVGGDGLDGLTEPDDDEEDADEPGHDGPGPVGPEQQHDAGDEADGADGVGGDAGPSQQVHGGTIVCGHARPLSCGPPRRSGSSGAGRMAAREAQSRPRRRRGCGPCPVGSAGAAAPGSARRYDRPPEHHSGVIRLHRPVDKFRARHGTVAGRGAGPRFGNSGVVVGLPPRRPAGWRERSRGVDGCRIRSPICICTPSSRCSTVPPGSATSWPRPPPTGSPPSGSPITGTCTGSSTSTRRPRPRA